MSNLNFIAMKKIELDDLLTYIGIGFTVLMMGSMAMIGLTGSMLALYLMITGLIGSLGSWGAADFITARRDKKDRIEQEEEDAILRDLMEHDDWGRGKITDSAHKRAPVGRRVASWRRSRAW